MALNLPKIICACGCRKSFKPIRHKQKFYNRECRYRYYNALRKTLKPSELDDRRFFGFVDETKVVIGVSSGLDGARYSSGFYCGRFLTPEEISEIQDHLTKAGCEWLAQRAAPEKVCPHCGEKI